MKTIKNELNYNEVLTFMKEFGVDCMTSNGELVFDIGTNTYADINHCRDIDDVKGTTIYNLCRPIGKGLDNQTANMLLSRVNDYFKTDLSRDDMRLMYRELCYRDKFEEFKSFVKRGFPMEELLFPNYKEDE